MRILGLSVLGSRAQQVMKTDERCSELLGIETDGELHLYELVVPSGKPAWSGHYSLTVKVVPVKSNRDKFRLLHMAISGQWQELDIEGSFEFCIRQILENRYHLFFG